MKYSKEQDKRFHGDIVGALRCAFRYDNVIPEHKNDGAPDILREYLKKRYSSSGGTVPNDYTYNVITFGFTASGGLILTFNTAVSKGTADKELAFSWSQLTTFLRNNMDEVFPTKAETEEQDKPPQLPAPAEETAVTFNYAVLSAELGDYLRRKEQQLKNEYMNFTANCGAIFAEAQEKLSGDNQYNGLFEKWIVSMGFKRDTVYRMINVHKFCSSQIATSKQEEIFDGLSKSLQYEIAKPSAPPELVEQVMSGDITTHKEYIALKKQLEQTEKSRDSAHKNFLEMSDENTKLTEKNFHLEEHIKELESRPVDVAVKPDTAAIKKRDAEIERLKKELFEAQNGGGSSDEQLAIFYETLHDKAKYALKDCVYFITETGLNDDLKEKLTEKFHNFSDLLEMYFDDLEE